MNNIQYSEHEILEAFKQYHFIDKGKVIQIMDITFDGQFNLFEGQICDISDLEEFTSLKRKKYQDLISKNKFICKEFYKGEELVEFYNGPQKVDFFIDATSYRFKSRIVPVAVVIIAGFVVIVPELGLKALNFGIEIDARIKKFEHEIFQNIGKEFSHYYNLTKTRQGSIETAAFGFVEIDKPHYKMKEYCFYIFSKHFPEGVQTSLAGYPQNLMWPKSYNI